MKLVIFLSTFLFFCFEIEAQHNYDNQNTIYSQSGNVGIGTSSPDSKLTVAGNVNIGGSGNAHLKIRHVDGKSYNSTAIDHLYLNYNTGKSVYVGFGGLQSKLLVSGNAVVYGKIETTEVIVSTTPTADFVFEEDYKLPPLKFIEEYIKSNKHLPEIACANEMEKNGVNIGNFQIQLLQKIEELTLYTIQQEKKIKKLEKENEQFKLIMERLEEIEKKLK